MIPAAAREPVRTPHGAARPDRPGGSENARISPWARTRAKSDAVTRAGAAVLCTMESVGSSSPRGKSADPGDEADCVEQSPESVRKALNDLANGALAPLASIVLCQDGRTGATTAIKVTGSLQGVLATETITEDGTSAFGLPNDDQAGALSGADVYDVLWPLLPERVRKALQQFTEDEIRQWMSLTIVPYDRIDVNLLTYNPSQRDYQEAPYLQLEGMPHGLEMLHNQAWNVVGVRFFVIRPACVCAGEMDGLDPSVFPDGEKGETYFPAPIRPERFFDYMTRDMIEAVLKDVSEKAQPGSFLKRCWPLPVPLRFVR